MYEHDVFLSYKRDNYWADFYAHLHDDLEAIFNLMRPQPAKDSVFLDVKPQHHGDWVKRLGQKVSRSRLFVPVVTPAYLGSGDSWCKLELSRALARQKRLGCNVIFPITLYIEVLPDELGRYEPFPLGNSLATPHIKKGTPKAIELYDALTPFAQELVRAIDEVPDHDPEWDDIENEQVEHLFHRQQQKQSLVQVGVGMAGR